MLSSLYRAAPRAATRFSTPLSCCRTISTAKSNSKINVIPADSSRSSFVLSYLKTQPPNRRLAIGYSTADPPTPQSFTENHAFIDILYEVLAEHAPRDQDLISQGKAFAGPGGANLGSGGIFFPQQNKRTARRSMSPKQGGGGGAGGDGAGGASGQGGAGGAGRCGYVHLSDRRNPPDYGRIAWPEDIFGSIEVDGEGNLVGTIEPSGTYRILTNDGILGLSPFLTEKVIERLRQEEMKDQSSS